MNSLLPVIPLLILVMFGLGVRAVVRRVRGADAPVAKTLGALVHIGAVLAAVNAVSDLIELALPSQDLFEDTTRLVALDIATLVVAVPAGYGLWRALFSADRDFGRRLAIVGGLAISMATTMFAAVSVGRALTPGFELEPASVGNLLAFGAAWVVYEWLTRSEPGGYQVSDLRETTGSALGLIFTVSGIVILITTALEAVFPDAGRVILEEGPADPLITAAVLLILGVPAFYIFWLQDLWGRETRFRNGYSAVVSYISLVALASVGGGILFIVVEWLLGFGNETAAQQFDELPVLLAGVIVSPMVWWHHLDVIDPRRGLARRSYSYGIGVTGILAGASAVVVLISEAIAAVASDAIIRTDRTSSLILGSVITALLGFGLWWRESQAADQGTPGELESTPRRVYLVGVLTIAGISGAIALIAVIFGLLQAMLEGEFDRSVWFDNRVALAVVLVTVPILWMFIDQIRSDRELRPAVVMHRQALVISGDFERLESNSSVRTLTRTDGLAPITPEVASEIEAVLAEPGLPIVILVSPDGLTVTEVEEL